MSFRHIWAVTRKEFHHIVRDRSTLILVLFTPTALLSSCRLPTTKVSPDSDTREKPSEASGLEAFR